MELAEFDTGEVILSAGLRSQLQKELKLAPATFTRALNDLIENNAIQKVFLEDVDEETGEIVKTEIKGQYLINPEMF